MVSTLQVKGLYILTPEQKKVVDRCERMLRAVFPPEYMKVVINLHPEIEGKYSYVERFGKFGRKTE